MAFPVWFKAAQRETQTHRKPEFLRKQGSQGAVGRLKSRVEDTVETVRDTLKTHSVQKRKQ